MPTSITIFLAVATALWLAGVASCLVALAWSGSGRAHRFPASLALCTIALALGYLGLTRFEMTYARRVNGQGWSISSKWFFLALMLLAVVSLLVVCWKHVSLSRNAGMGDRPPGDSFVV